MIGVRILALRKERGLSQEDLATQLMVSRQAISKWELGESIPDTDNIVQLSRLFGVSTDFLLIDDEGEVVLQPQPSEQGTKWTGQSVMGVVIALLVIALVVVSFAFRAYVTREPAEAWPHGTFVDRDQAALGAVLLVLDGTNYMKYRQDTDDGDWEGEIFDDGTFQNEILEAGALRPVSRGDGIFRIIREGLPTVEMVYANERIYWPNGDGTFTVFFLFDPMPMFINVSPPWGPWDDEIWNDYDYMD